MSVRAALVGAVFCMAGATVAVGPASAADPGRPGWSSKVVDTSELPIGLPGPNRSTPPTAPLGPSTTALAARVTRSAATGPREAPPAADPIWARIRQCESGNRYTLNTGNGYYGAYQFAAGTWRRLGLPGLPHEAAPAMQDEAARLLYVKAGWGVWGQCARRLGLR